MRYYVLDEEGNRVEVLVEKSAPADFSEKSHGPGDHEGSGLARRFALIVFLAIAVLELVDIALLIALLTK